MQCRCTGLVSHILLGSGRLKIKITWFSSRRPLHSWKPSPVWNWLRCPAIFSSIQREEKQNLAGSWIANVESLDGDRTVPMTTIHGSCTRASVRLELCEFPSMKTDQRSQLLCGVRWRCRRWGSPSPRWSPSSPPCPGSAGSPSCCCRQPSSPEPSVSRSSGSSSPTDCFLGSGRSQGRRGRPFAPETSLTEWFAQNRFWFKSYQKSCHSFIWPTMPGTPPPPALKGAR